MKEWLGGCFPAPDPSKRGPDCKRTLRPSALGRLRSFAPRRITDVGPNAGERTFWTSDKGG